MQWTSLSLRHVGASYVMGIHCTRRARMSKKKVIKHCSIAPKDLDIQTRFVLKNSRNKFDWLVHEVLLLGELIMSNKK